MSVLKCNKLVYRDFFTVVARNKLVYRDFFTKVVPLNSGGMARRPWRNQMDGSTSVSLGVGSGADELLADVFNDVCAGRRRPARRTAALSVRKLVWANTSSGKSGHMTRSFLRRRLTCFARALISSSGGVRGVARGSGIAVMLILLDGMRFLRSSDIPWG